MQGYRVLRGNCSRRPFQNIINFLIGFRIASGMDFGWFWEAFWDHFRTNSWSIIELYKKCIRTGPRPRTPAKSHAFWEQKSSNFDEKVGSRTVLVPKSRFYRFCITFGCQNDLLLVTLGLLWFTQGDLVAHFGDPLDPKSEISSKSALEMCPESLKWPPKVIKKTFQSHSNVVPKRCTELIDELIKD